MNDSTIFVIGPFIVAGLAAAGLLLTYLPEHGGVSNQEVPVYFETSVLDLSNRRCKSLRSMIHVQMTYLKYSYVIRKTEVGMIYRFGVAGLRE
jgi:hypothetical protein